MTEIATDTMTAPEDLADVPTAHETHEENFGLAVVAGLGAAAVGAVLWAVFVYATGLELGLVAIAVGALVGLAIQKTGRSSDRKFGILGAICAALGWAAGSVLCDVGLLAKEAGVSFFDALSRLGIGGSVTMAFQAADAMELLFLAIAVWEGYKLSTRQR